MLTPQLSGLAHGCDHGPPIRFLPVLSSLEGEEALEQQAALAQVFLLQLILCFEILAARLKCLLRSFMETLPICFDVLARTLAQGAPLFLQILDLPRQRSGMQRRADERLHLCDQFSAFGRDRKTLPVLQFLKLRIELCQLTGEMSRQWRSRSEFFPYSATQSRGHLAVA